MSEVLAKTIRNAIPVWQHGNEKQGNKKVQDAVRDALTSAGYFVDQQDRRHFLKPEMPVWQRYQPGGFLVEKTKSRRLIDLVVYDPNNRAPLALVEVESDLAHLSSRTNKFSTGCYAVASIARNASGNPFNSYNSLERMAAAVQYWAMGQASSGYPRADEGVSRLQAICSDLPEEHNPTNICLFLVSHFAKPEHAQSLKRRLDSLRAQLIVGTWGG